MTNTRDSARQILSFNQAIAVCNEIRSAGENIFYYLEQLHRSGFEACLPFEEFFVSFASDPEQIKVHNQYLIETAKTVLGTPWPIALAAEHRALLFRSELIQAMKARRDEANGVPEGELESRFGPGESWWRKQIDPCWRNMARLQVTDRDIYDAKWAAVVDSMKFQVQQESQRFSSDLSKAHTMSEDGRYSLYINVMTRDAGVLGFRYDKFKSTIGFPIFSKSINDKWDLCWAIEEPKRFFWSPFEGHFMPHLEIRSRKLRSSVAKATPGEFIQIRYAASVPGFFNAYRIFYSVDELETLIKAHLCLYSFMAPIIEGGASSGLSGS
jgi:hypothetical protein